MGRNRSRSRSSSDGDDEGTRLHIGDLAPDCSKRDLEKEFEKYGELLELWTARAPPCFGFAVFKNKIDAFDAMDSLNGKVVGGSRIKVSLALPRVRTRTKRLSYDGDLRCYQCGERGHFARECTGRHRSPEDRRRRKRSSREQGRRRRQDSRSRSRSRGHSRSRGRSRNEDPDVKGKAKGDRSLRNQTSRGDVEVDNKSPNKEKDVQKVVDLHAGDADDDADCDDDGDGVSCGGPDGANGKSVIIRRDEINTKSTDVAGAKDAGDGDRDDNCNEDDDDSDDDDDIKMDIPPFER